MKRYRKFGNPIAVSMLDVISNALAGVLVLFFVLSSMRLEHNRIKYQTGILVFEYEYSPSSIEPLIFVDGPGSLPVKFGRDIRNPNNRYAEQTNYSESALQKVTVLKEQIGDKQKIIIQIVDPAYSVKSSSSSPEDGIWKTGFIYADHKNILKRKIKAKIKFRALFIDADGKTHTTNGTNTDEQVKPVKNDTFELKTPTEYKKYEVSIPEYLNQ